ncbi:conserved Plasmodium protein, unknown function [Plasmodium malariae]|uniref:Uncharacterized protein n=2 Tax=Plasmodium (Plasmodium) TaxID=418103 RepID=A0A1A8WWY2_PLAMA|nr:conserved Plasmodium protein, unknown function [Plasmodium malariae]SBS95865.1 conserved Plasmodium protein, unknown function [Plasmodium malariae]SBT87791.1 conserved Plasmodium protein, unknown function [Plasmodium malariae]
MIYLELFFCIVLLLFNKNKYNVNNLNLKKKKNAHPNIVVQVSKRNGIKKYSYDKLTFLFFKNFKKWDENKTKKKERIYFERNGINVPQDIAMFGKTNVYYIRESIYNKDQNNLVPNEIDAQCIEELDDMEAVNDPLTRGSISTSGGSSTGDAQNTSSYVKEYSGSASSGNSSSDGTSNSSIDEKSARSTGQRDLSHNSSDHKQDNRQNNIFSYLNKERDYITQVGNSPKVDVYERRYKADVKTINRIFENINEVNIQLLKDIKSIDEKEKIINKKVIEKVREDIKKYQETNEIMDMKGNIIKPSSENKNKGKTESKDKGNTSYTDMDEEEKNEVIKKLYMIDKKTDKYLEENVYFVLQSWLPDIRIDDTLIIIDNIEKFYNDFDISKYYEKFKEIKNRNFSYDLNSYEIENVPRNINDDTEIECEHIRSYNNTYNKLNYYNLKKYSYTYSTNDNMDTTFKKNEPMPPIVIINTKKNYMVQEWECKNFKNRQKRNKAHEFTRLQRAFRPFSYVDLSDISCIYRNNFLQLKMKLSHRKYVNDVYPYFVPINKNSNEQLFDFNGYKKNGDYAWSFFWHNFKYDPDTDYSFLNKNVKLNLTETKFEDVNKKKSIKIMKKISKERKGK